MNQPGAVPARTTVTRRVRFSAARSLHSAQLDEPDNERLFGADSRLHGREFVLDVTVAGELPLADGMVMDLKALSLLLKREIVARFDRRVLDDSELLAGWPPTTENLAIAIWNRIEPKLAPVILVEVALSEGIEKRVRYKGERDERTG